MGRINLSSFSEVQDFGTVQSIPVTKAVGKSPDELYKSVWGESFEKVEFLNVRQLSHYSDDKGVSQPFRLNEEKITQIMKSAEDIGIITPLIVRHTDNLRYQIIAGHHRYEAAKRLNLLTVPCIIRSIDDSKAFQIVAESNIQRGKILPSEYGRIFSAYMEKRSDVEMTAQEIADKFGISKKNMYRYINVTKLIVKLQEYTDDGIILLAAADIISKFSESNQETVKALLEIPTVKKITPEIAKKFSEVIEEYDGDNVPMHEFTKLFEPKPKRKYRSNVYNSLSARLNFDKSEEELDELTEKLLAEYFLGKV